MSCFVGSCNFIFEIVDLSSRGSQVTSTTFCSFRNSYGFHVRLDSKIGTVQMSIFKRRRLDLKPVVGTFGSDAYVLELRAPVARHEKPSAQQDGG